MTASAPAITLNTPTLLTNGASTTSATSYNTASISPTANARILVWVVSTGAGAATFLSGNGITYNLVATSDNSTAGYYLTLWSGTAASPSAGQITISHAGSRTGCAWIVQQWTADVTPTVRQFKVGENEVGGVTSASITLDTTPASTSATAGGFYKVPVESSVAGDGFTALGDTGYSAPTTWIFSEYDLPPSATNPAVSTWTTASIWGGIAIEVGGT